MIKIWLVEDDIVIARSLMLIFKDEKFYEITNWFSNAEMFLDKLKNSNPPDAVLMDITLPEMNGIDALRIAKKDYTFEAIMLTVHVDDNIIFDALCAGASGYLLKNTPTAKIKSAIKEALEGGAPMSTQIARKVVDSFKPNMNSLLSQREADVLNLLCEGKSYNLIASELFISTDTVRAHIRSIYKKLEVNSNIEAVAKAYKNNWV